MLGKTLLRILVGALFAGHGAQKLFGRFGGHGPEGTGAAFEQMGVLPGRQMATAAGASELAGGTLLALGAATPVGTAMLSGVMSSAIERVHLKNGPWTSDGGYEYNLVLLAVLFHLADEGPGPISIDRLRRSSHHGFGWAVLQLAAGVGGAMAVKTVSGRMAQQQAPSPEAWRQADGGGDAAEAAREPAHSNHGANGTATAPARSSGQADRSSTSGAASEQAKRASAPATGSTAAPGSPAPTAGGAAGTHPSPGDASGSAAGTPGSPPAGTGT